MRSKKEQEEERYFGIQKFENVKDAFYVMLGCWGDINSDAFTNLTILDDEQFCKYILLRAAEKYIELKEGRITKEECDKCLMKSEVLNDYLLDFDFFLLSEATSSFFTSRMSFKDDACHMWNERQWDYFYELDDAYDFSKYIDKGIILVDTLWDEYGVDTINEIMAIENIVV